MDPWLSVVMPTFRGERYLREALASIVAQSDAQIEVLIVDDGSDDDTLRIVAEYTNRIPIRVLEGARRKNWVASTNVALREARGLYACFLHQDDAWEPTRLARIRRALDRYPKVRLIVHAATLVDSQGAALTTWRASLGAANTPLAPADVLEHLLVQNSIAIPTPTFRIADARLVGGLDEALWYTADWDFWLRLAMLGDTLYLDEPLARFRVHGDSQTILRSRDSNDLRTQMVTVLERHLPRANLNDEVEADVEKAARLSIDVNVALASLAHRSSGELIHLARSLVASGPRTLHRYVRDSRIVDRVGGRLLATVRGRLKA